MLLNSFLLQTIFKFPYYQMFDFAEFILEGTIGLAYHYGDLYVFHAQPLCCNTFPLFSSNLVSSLEHDATLWHHRLGHISDFVHQCITT